MKFYMEKDGDWAFPLSEFTARIHTGEKEIFLEEMRKEIVGEVYCDRDWYFGDESECGELVCNNYKPSNGRPGLCRYLKSGYIGSGEKFRLTNKGLDEIK